MILTIIMNDMVTPPPPPPPPLGPTHLYPPSSNVSELVEEIRAQEPLVRQRSEQLIQLVSSK